MTTTTPIFITMSEIARELGYTNNNFSYILKTHHDDPNDPCPAPDAHYKVHGGYLSPLWLPTRIPQWKAWDQRRQPRKHGRLGNTPP